MPAAEQKDLDQATDYLLEEWPFLPPETTGSIIMTANAFLNKFSTSPLREELSGGSSSMTPHDVITKNEIHIINYPTSLYGMDTARLCHLAYKYPFDRAVLRRNVDTHTNVIVKWVDEFQLLITTPSGGASRENEVLQISRSARLAHVYITQSITNVAEALGEQSIGPKTKALLGNLGLKAFFQNNDIDTNNYAADLIGKAWQDVANSGTSGHDIHFGSQHQLQHLVDPISFSRLHRPDSVDPVAEAIIVGSREFKATCTAQSLGDNWLLTQFRR